MKNILVALLVGILSTVSFANEDAIHMHPSVSAKSSPSGKALQTPTCMIKIVNDSHDDIIVYGTFDDGVVMTPFVVYAYENPHYILLDYNGFCHAGMDIGIDTTDGQHLYRDYTWVNSRLRILSGWFKPYIVLDR